MRAAITILGLIPCALTFLACRGDLAIGGDADETGSGSSSAGKVASSSAGSASTPPSTEAGATEKASTASGWIVFDSDQDQLIAHIFAAHTDGSDFRELTSGTSTDT